MKCFFSILLISFSVLVLNTVLVAQSCLVTHYTRNHYAAGSQNWSIDIDRQGFVYVANNNGLMKYDGVHWKVFPLPSHSIVRSVSVSPDGRIYTGSNEEFGYWESDAKTCLKYVSLVPLLKGHNLHNQEIWKIVQFNNKVYFQGFSSLFVYDKLTVKPIILPGPVIFLLKAGNHLFAHAVQGDMYEVINDKLVNINQSRLLYGTEVKAILPYKKNSFLIGTSSKGVFVLHDKTITPWNVPANPLLKEFQINNGIVFGNKIVFGTIVNGLLVLDSNGIVLNHLFSENDLQNNTVLSLCNDNNQGIWIGLDNGIDNVSFNKPVDIYPVRNEALGSVYAAALKENTLYIGTNRGIFTYTKVGEKFIYDGFLPNSQGQVWQLKIIDDNLFCGRNGTFKIEGKTLYPVSSVNGGYMLQKILHNNIEYLIQSTFTSLVIYKKQGKTWVFSHLVKGFLEPARFMEVDPLGNIWIGHLVKGLYRLRLSDSMDKVIEKQLFDQKSGITSEQNIRVFKIANRVVFSNGETLFTWDDIKQQIIPYTELNSKLYGFEAATSITAVNDTTYWFTTKTEAALFNIKGSKPEMLYRIILNQYNLNMVDGYENIIPLSENLHLICLDNGFAVFNKNTALESTSDSKLVIRGLDCWDANGNKYRLYAEASSVTLSNSKNNLSVSFSTIQSPCSRKLYQYKLEGIDGDWGKWSETPEAQFLRLPVGKYIFKVRTLNPNGTISDEVSLTIKVKPAWYASVLATLIYFLLGFAGIVASQYWYRKRLDKHHDRLHMIADEKRELEKQHSEQEIMKLQNENLHAEISHKNMQLADSTLSIIKKNEVLIEIKNELEKQKEELGVRYPARYLQRLTTLIDKNISNDNDWEMFEALFDQAHENFFKRLKQSFPDLTQSDLKLCAYLKLNLSSKEIAPLLNISIRGVEIRRYRLRKRLALASDENLVAYIMQF
ncbi:MAG: triple tyrosine motif-containing protein [Bacteroidales bacterium]